MSGAVKVPVKTWRVVISRSATIERTIEADTSDAARKLINDVFGLHDFALAFGGKVTADHLSITSITESMS